MDTEWWTFDYPPGQQPTSAGLRMDFGLAPGDPVQAGVRRYDMTTGMTCDFHEGLEIGIVLKGAQLRQWGVYETELGPGEIWFCRAWEPHGWSARVAGTEVAVVVFLPEFLGELKVGDAGWLSVFAAAPPERPRAVRARTRAHVLNEGQSIAIETRKRLPLWRDALRAHLVRALCAVTEGWSPGKTDQPAPTFGVTDLQRINPALKLVDPMCKRLVSVEEAAAMCGLSRARFSTLFRSTMGLSFHAFCQRARVTLAAQMLLATDLSLDRLADECGFSSASHLHKAFLKHYSCTPGGYRAQHRVAENPRRGPA